MGSLLPSKLDQSEKRPSYAEIMEGEPHILLRLSTSAPIELGDFASAFTSLGHEYDRFIKSKKPDLAYESSIYVKEVRQGSIEAELLNFAWVGGIYAISQMDKLLILEQFVRLYGERLKTFFAPGGRLPEASKGELADFMGALQAIANDPNDSAEIAAAHYEDGARRIKAAVKFRTPEAKAAIAEIAAQRNEMDNKADADHKRVLLRFVRPSIEGGKPGKRTGERAIIDRVHPKSLPIVYASDLAEQRIHHEMREAEGNVFRKLFDVDVNVELRSDGRPLAYRIMAVHSVTDAPDEEEDAA